MEQRGYFLLFRYICAYKLLSYFNKTVNFKTLIFQRLENMFIQKFKFKKYAHAVAQTIFKK